MMMRVFENDVRIAADSVTHDTGIKRVVPNGCGRNNNTQLSNWLGQLFKVFFLIFDDFAARLFERWGVE